MPTELQRRLYQDIELKDVAIYLDSLTHGERLLEIYSLSKKEQKKLFFLASTDLELKDLIPPQYPSLKEVIFYGKNTLPFFRHFQKRMCRSIDGQELWGYNHQTLMGLTGPGYYVVREQTDRTGEAMIDYTRIPYEAPSSWPPIKSNETGVTRLVYGGMKDFLRRVSREVFIGEAAKKEQSLDNYFILCRPPL